MIQYILESVAFQLLFLVIYDLFLKRETFFQWNRVYLLGTFVATLVLPWIKIEALKTTVSREFIAYPEYLWGMDMSEGIVVTETATAFNWSWYEILLYGGMVIAALIFVFKLFQIQQLKNRGEVHYFKHFTQVVVAKSNIAFSFFSTIFLGDEILKKEHQSILQHELVHIQQRHSLDLIFFELMRIVLWFNPLVYVYQSRISELHEFIADAKVAKTHKKEHYQNLLSQVFQTQHISFINQFFKSSLIKKRIVMLQKSKSKKVWQLKYLVLVPLIGGMLLYTSCEQEKIIKDNEVTLSAKIEELANEIESKSLTEEEREELVKMIYRVYPKDIQGISGKDGSLDFNGVPFSMVDEVPVFPKCAEEDDKIECFQKSMQEHIRKHFNYPAEAQEKGIQGRVSIMFTIGAEGDIHNIKMRGPDKLLEDEAERIIKRLPKMKPGMQQGEPVNVTYSIPITFKLQ